MRDLLHNIPALLVVGFFLLVTIAQQFSAAKKAYDKTVERQRAERDAQQVTLDDSAQQQPPYGAPVPRSAPGPSRPRSAADPRSALLAQIEAMARSASVEAAASQAAAARAETARYAAQQAARARPVAAPAPTVAPTGAAPVMPAAVRTTQPVRRALDLPPAFGAPRPPSLTKRLLAGAFGDPAHARNSVIVAEVLGPPVSLR